MSNHPDITILSILNNLAETTPLTHFVSDGSSSNITYQTASILSNLISSRLRQLSAYFQQESKVKVALISRNNALIPLTLWALWKVGAVAIPLSATAEAPMWVSMAMVAQADIIVVERYLRHKLDSALRSTPGYSSDVIELESLVPTEHFGLQDRRQDTPPPFSIVLACNRWAAQARPHKSNQSPIASSISPSTSVVTLFTSSAIDATTLKCVTYTHAMLVRSSLRTIKALGGGAYSRTPKRHLGWLPLSHCFELTVSLCGIVIMTGGTYVLHDSRVSSPNLSGGESLSVVVLESLLYHQPIQSFCTIPAILEKLPEGPSSDYSTALRALESLCVGGAMSSKTLYDWARRENIAYVDYLGATEVAGGICTRRLQDSMDGLEVMDGLMGLLEKESSQDDVGELLVIGRDLPQRYDNLESSAFERVSQDGTVVYRTGDLYGQKIGYVQRSVLRGEELPAYDPSVIPLAGLYYIGRCDDIVALNSGTKVDALALERLLDSMPEIQRSAVVLNGEGDGLLALVEADDTKAFSQATTVEAVLRVNGSLPFEKRIRPENIVIVDSLPLTTKSTLHRKKLKKILRDASGSWPQDQSHMHHKQYDQGISREASPPMPSTDFGDILQDLQKILSQVLSIPLRDAADPSLSFSELGITSIASVRLASVIQQSFGIEIKSSQLFGIRNASELCKWIVQARTKHTNLNIMELPLALSESTSLDLAITGASCRFPGGIDSLDKFWDALVSPQNFSSFIARPAPPSRWSGVSNLDLPDMGWIDDLERNDLTSFGSFFELRPTEIRAMPPNARLALKMAFSAIEDSGIAPKSLDGKPWGIFSSVNDSGWRERRLEEIDIEEYGKTWGGLADDAVGARLSYFLNLTGPAIEVKTACSSSAVAIHQACAAIRNGDCEAAIIVSATTHLFPAGSVFRKSAGIASSLGRCATFSQDADGFLPSEGAAAIIIQKAEDACGDIYAYVKGSAITQDGRSRSFSAPNPAAQTRLLNMALERSGVTPNDISYIETHGTGTRLGDAIEINAINQSFGYRRTRPLLIGAVKSVIGHTEECAGLAGIIKCLLCFNHNAIPPQPNIIDVNEEFDLFSSKLVIPRRVTSFSDQGRPRLIGVSAFGLSGTLAHVVLQEGPRSDPPIVEFPEESVFVVSGRSSVDLVATLHSWLEYMESPLSRESSLKDICFTTQIARDRFAYRYAWPVFDHRGLISVLRKAITLSPPSRAPKHPDVSIWFSAIPANHASPLSINHPTYHATILECREGARGSLHGNLEDYARQLAVARTIASLGGNIVAVGGEGPGEFIAAAFAGVFNIHNLFSLLSAMEPVKGYKVVSVKGSHNDLMERLLDFGTLHLRVRARHDSQTTVVGVPEAIEQFRLRNNDLLYTPGPDALNLRLSQIVPLSLARGHCSVISAHVGGVLDDRLLLSNEYWNGILDRQFDTRDAHSRLAERSDFTIDLPGTELTPRKVTSETEIDGRHGNGMKTSVPALFARLFEAGCDLDWKSLGKRGRILHLPTYQWGLDLVS